MTSGALVAAAAHVSEFSRCRGPRLSRNNHTKSAPHTVPLGSGLHQSDDNSFILRCVCVYRYTRVLRAGVARDSEVVTELMDISTTARGGWKHLSTPLIPANYPRHTTCNTHTHTYIHVQYLRVSVYIYTFTAEVEYCKTIFSVGRNTNDVCVQYLYLTRSCHVSYTQLNHHIEA